MNSILTSVNSKPLQFRDIIQLKPSKTVTEDLKQFVNYVHRNAKSLKFVELEDCIQIETKRAVYVYKDYGNYIARFNTMNSSKKWYEKS